MRGTIVPISDESSAQLAEISLLFAGDRIEEAELVLAGHSHLEAIAGSLSSREPASAKLLAAHRTAILNGVPSRDYWRALTVVAPGKTIVLSWMGNQHMSFLFAPFGYFDFIYSKKPELPLLAPWDMRAAPMAAAARWLRKLFERGRKPTLRAKLAPEQLVRDHFAASLAELSALLSGLLAAGARKVIVLGTPASRGEEADVLARVGGDVFFQDMLDIFLDQVGSAPVTPLSVRVKIWGALQDGLEETALAAGACFLKSPDESFDWKNGLKPDYWAADISHANENYGALVVQQLGLLP
jgi:hypothetical protein